MKKKKEKTEYAKRVEAELDDLRSELENFQQEKERVRAIVGKIGGVPTFNTKTFNYIFAAVIVITLGVSFAHEEWRLMMIELATAALAVKILYMMHCQNRVNHFQLWMQSSIEWRINEIMKMIRELNDKVDSHSNSSSQ